MRASWELVTVRARSEQRLVIVYEPKNISNNGFSHELKVMLRRVGDRKESKSREVSPQYRPLTKVLTVTEKKGADFHADVRIFDSARDPTFNQGNHIGVLVLPRRKDSGRPYIWRMAREAQETRLTLGCSSGRPHL